MSLPRTFIALTLAGYASWALAQTTAPPKEASANETLEPAVNTSASDSTQAADPRPSPHPRASPKQTPDQSDGHSTPASKPVAKDRLELDTTQITGNRELPKVLYIVPWKRADLGDLLGKPVNSLLDEVLEPVDRDVFKRENRYYRALQPDTAAAAPSSAPAQPPAHSE